MVLKKEDISQYLGQGTLNLLLIWGKAMQGKKLILYKDLQKVEVGDWQIFMLRRVWCQLWKHEGVLTQVRWSTGLQKRFTGASL